MCVAAIGSSSKPTKRTVLVLNVQYIQQQPDGSELKFVQGLMYGSPKGLKSKATKKNLAMQICFPELGARESVIRFLSALLPP